MKRNLIYYSILIFLISCSRAVCYSVEIPLNAGDGASFGYVDMNRVFDESKNIKEAKQEYEKLKNDKEAELKAMGNEIIVSSDKVKEAIKEIEQLKDRLKSLTEQPVAPVQVNVPSNEIASPNSVPAVPASSAAVTTPSVSSDSYKSPAISSGPPTVNIVSTSSVTKQVAVDTMTVSVPPSTPPVSPSIPRQDTGIASLQTQIIQKQTDLAIKMEDMYKKIKLYDDSKQKLKSNLDQIEESKTLALMGDIYKTIQAVAAEENISVIVDKAHILYGFPKIDLTDKVIDRLRSK